MKAAFMELAHEGYDKVPNGMYTRIGFLVAGKH
jgi:hypothetical protein